MPSAVAKSSRRVPWVVIGTLVLAAVIVGAYRWWPREPAYAEAWRTCRERAVAHLTAPSTALWLDEGPELEEPAPGVLFLEERLEAENRFGGRITQKVHCVLMADQDSWGLEGLFVGGEEVFQSDSLQSYMTARTKAFDRSRAAALRASEQRRAEAARREMERLRRQAEGN